jgi:hypothetical protein
MGWISFDLPHIKLNPRQKYIAWLSMSGLENEDDASFGVRSSEPNGFGGQPKPNQQVQPKEWRSAYPEGTRAYFRGSNSDGKIDVLLQSPWEVEGSGRNLYFKMAFENRKR